MFGQRGGIREGDSLLRLLPLTGKDQQRADILNNLATLYMNINPKKGIAWAREALVLSEQIQYDRGIADADINLGTSTLVSNIEGNRKEASQWFSLARKLSEKIGYKTGLGRISFWEAMLYLNTSEYAKCLESANQARAIFEDTHNYYELVAVYDIFEILYFQIRDMKKGEEMALKGLEMADKYHSYIFKSEMLYQLGYYIALDHEGNTEKALDYYHKALANSEALGLNTYSSTVMGYIAHIYTKRKEYHKAIDFYNKSIEIEEKNDIEFSKGWAVYNIGKLYLRMVYDTNYMMNNRKAHPYETREYLLNQAIVYSEKAMESARKRSERDYVFYIYFVLSEAYKNLGNFKLARDYYKMQCVLRDSITSVENQRELTNVETRLLMDVQKKEMELQERSNDNKMNFILFLMVFLAVIIITSILVIRNQQRAQALLLNILPPGIAHRLRKKEKPIADYFEKVSVVFIDIVNFTPMAALFPPDELVKILNKVYTEFDRISSKFGMEKIKTIGDCYMVAAGLPEPMKNHSFAASMFALEAMQSLSGKTLGNGVLLNFRCGIDCGPVVAGVIGEKKFIYDLWGDTVNMAARMEQSSEPGKIQVTERFIKELQQSEFESPSPGTGMDPKAASVDPENIFTFIERGRIEIKGKGLVSTCFLKY
jgi:class 3 adenylate cyclase/tetratricopeptide (TPR) repeat protein